MSYQTALRDLPPLSETRGLGRPPAPPPPPELCEAHGQSLSEFCVDDLEPMCERCAAENHAGHRAYLLTEAAIDCKEELRTSLKELNMKMVDCRKVSQACQHTSRYNQAEAKLAEEHMNEEFEALHQFLRQEEASRLQALREELDEKMRRAEERRGEINQVIKSLEEKIQLAEAEMDAGGDGGGFVQNYKDTMNSSWVSGWTPQNLCRPLIDVAKHLGNLHYAVWARMKQLAPFTPVTFDPRTAGQALQVSAGHNSVLATAGASRTGGGVAAALEHPDRFHPHSCVVAGEGFSSGVHSWTVQVGDTDNWTLGVAAQWVCRKAAFEASPEGGLWCISLMDGTYHALTTPSKILQVSRPDRPRRVRLRLDWEAGTLTFTNPDINAHLYTFTHRFSELVYPYFETITPGGSLALLGQRVTLGVGVDCVPGEDPLIISEEELLRRESTHAKHSVTSADASDTKTVAGRSDEDRKSPHGVVKEAETTKAKAGKNKASHNKTAAKQQNRLNVTYQVSLNRALHDGNHQLHKRKETEQ